MVEVWILVLFCANIARCEPNQNTQTLGGMNGGYESEVVCQRAGMNILNSARHTMQDRIAVCIKGLKPNGDEQ